MALSEMPFPSVTTPPLARHIVPTCGNARKQKSGPEWKPAGNVGIPEGTAIDWKSIDPY